MHRFELRGFTVVELLIILVVIAILATITIIGYTGIQEKAKADQARSDLSSLQRETSRWITNNYQNFPSTSAHWSEIFRTADLFQKTRASSYTFAICYTSTNYSIVAGAPVLKETSGNTTYFVNNSSGLGTFAWNTSTTGTYQIDKACAQSPTGSGASKVWAHQLV